MDDPRSEEWEAIVPLISNQSSPIARQVWQTLHSSASWFQLLDSLKIVEQWLSSGNEEWIDKATTLLSRMQKQLPDRVAELLEPYIDVSDAWQNRLIFLMQWADVGAGQRFFELFLRLIDNGILDDVRGQIVVNSEFWNLIYSLPKQQPDWSCEVIGHYLNRRLSLSLAASQPNPFDRERGTIPDSQFAESVFVESARNAPEAYVTNVLPFMLQVMDLTAYKQNNPPWHDPIWRFRTYGIGYGIDDLVLKVMETSLSALATHKPDVFWIIAESQLLNSNFETIQHLLVRAFTANAERFADEAVSYLCEKPVRLKQGYSFVTGNAHAAPFWATRELLEAVTLHCSVDQLERLESVVLTFYTAYEKSAEQGGFI